MKFKNKTAICLLFFVLAFSLSVTCISAADDSSNLSSEQSSNGSDLTISDPTSTANTEEEQNNVENTSLNPQTTVNEQDTNSSTTQTTQNTTSNKLTNSSYNEDPVVITFDDGFESTYTVAFPIMQQYGIKGTVYVTPAWIGSPGYLTVTQLTALQNAGWTIANHSWDHPPLPSLTTTQITNEIQTTIDWLNSNGFADGAYHLAYPFGQYNNNVLQVASNLGIKTARTVNWGTISIGDTDYLELPIILIRMDTTRNEWQSELDSSIAQGNTVIFLFHDIVTGNPVYLEDVTVANFRTIIEYINQTGVKTETISQWYNERVNIDSLSIGITSNKTNYNPGENVVYNLDIFNNGSNTATSVVVKTTLPAGLTFVSATNGGVYNAGVITWSLANLAANSHFKPSFTATVNQGTEGQNIQSTASVSSAQVPTPVTSQATIHVNNPNTSAEIIINFDDGLESVYTVAFPIMQQYGIKGTVYVVTDWVGDPGYLTKSQLTALLNAGWTITNHSYRHWWMTDLSTTQITNEIQTAINWLNSNGFTEGAYHFAYPYGEYNSNVLQAASGLGIKTARTIKSGTINPDGNINYLELPSNGFTRSTTTAQWKSWVDQAIATNTASIILLHSIVNNPSITEDVSISTFTAFIQYLAQTGVKTGTISEWYNAMNNPGPVAAFTATPTSGGVPLQVQFTDQSTGSSLSYSWDFNNDGTVDSTAKNPVYTYNAAGTYTVKLTVTNTEGSNSLTKTNYITVNVAPVANFTATPVTGTAPLTVTFSDQSTGNPTSYAWDFNNDGTVDSTAKNPSYTYSAAGTYTVKLTVTNSAGSNSLTRTGYITVNYSVPVANFTAAPASGSAPLTVQFTDQSTGSPTSWAWDFNNDGTIDSNSKNPTYTYGSPGTYTVKLTVTNSMGTDEEIKTNYITVTNASLPDLLTINQQGVETNLTGFDSYLCTLTRDTGVKYEGNASAKAVASSGFSQLMFAGNSIPVTAGKDYIASAYVMADVAALGSQTITILYDWYGSGGHSAYTYQWVNLSDIGENTWHYLELAAKAPAGATSVYMSIAMGNAVSGDTYWYDDGGLREVANTAPVANFTAAPVTGTAPLQVQFTDQSTGNPTSYSWDFNNDGTVDSTSKNPLYTYNTPGTYTVKLTVTNSVGNNSLTKTGYITVNVAPTVANFTATPTSGTAPLTVQFTDKSTGSGLTYQWDFNNDGAVDSTAQNPSYTYSNTGTYTVKLTVTSAAGSDEEIKTNYITVASTMPDLVISNLQVPINPLAGTTYPVNFTVKNNGSANAGSFLVNLMDGSTLIGQRTISSLASGQNTTVTFNWIPAITGLRTISATADVNNTIAETNETNNNITQQVTVGGQSSPNLLTINQQGVETNLTGFDSYLCTLTRDTGVKYEGNASAKAVASSGFSQLMFAGNSIPVTAGKDYIASAYVMADVAALGSQTITILYDWYGSGGHSAYTYQWVNLSDIGENTWHYLELAAKAPAGATSVYMSIAMGNAVSGDTYWYDNGDLHAV